MDDPPLGAEGADVLPPAEAAAPADLARPAGDDRCKLSVGARWRGFHVGSLVPGRSPNVFEATDIGQMEDVLIVATPVTKATEWRKGAWQKLCTQMPPEARILGCKEAFAEDGWRYEVMNRPPPTSLREWMSSHHADGGTHKILLEQLTGALSALHSSGIVHLNIRPETIYVDEKGDHIDIVLGGLEAAALYNQSNLTVPDLDPFYAPPEAVDPAGLKPGIGLCAWDWWTLGRVIQELVLGRHVMSVLFGSDVIREPTPQLRAQAEALLQEREPPGVRAGAVEAMSKLDPAMETVLHGLLTTVRDARWNGDLVRRWLAKEKVSHHYDLARDTRFFTWKGRGFSLPEAVEFFCAEENWADGEENIFNPQNPETLANFLSNVPEHKADWQKVRQIHAQVEAPAWSAVPAPARRTVTTALAWLTLAPQAAGMVLRGQRIDAAGLAALLSDSRNSYNYANVKALMSPPSLALIRPLDGLAAEILTQLATVGNEALRRAEPPHWIDPEDPGSQAHLLKLALETETSLQTRADKVRAAYATNRDPELARMLADKQPAPWANLLLIITAEDPRRFGYVTKAEHARQQLAGMQTRSEKMHGAVFWLRLQRMLLTGGPFTGRWDVFAVCWFVLVGLGAVVAREVATTFYLAIGLVALRRFFSWRVGLLVRRCDQAAQPWNWRDGPRRCVQEAQRIWPEATAGGLAGLTQQLATMEGQMAELTPADGEILPKSTPLLAGLWVGLAVGTSLCVLGAVRVLVNTGQAVKAEVAMFSQAKPVGNAPEVAARVVAPAPSAAAALPNIPGLTPEMRQRVARGEYEVVDEGFGLTLHGPITKWDLFSPGAPAPLPVEARVPATPSQRAYATVSAELLLQPYGRKAVNALLVVQVPTRDKIGVMIYNARDRLLESNVTLVMREQLSERTWYRFENRRVVFLGLPPEIKKENSLALR